MNSVELSVLNTTFTTVVVFLVAGGIILVPFAFFRNWYFYRRRLKKNVITVEYETPLGLNPAEVGYLFDGMLREQEVGATIIHLVQRGQLKVRKVDDKKRIFYVGTTFDSLKSYERKLCEEAAHVDGVTADDILSRFTHKTVDGHTKLGTREFIFTQLVHQDLERVGYVKGSFAGAFFTLVLRTFLALSVLVIYIPLFCLFIIASVQSGTVYLSGFFILFTIGFFINAFGAFPIFIASIILAFFQGRILGRQWIITDKLKKMWPQLVGFRLYIKLVESDKLTFQTEELKAVSKNSTLPYAVALGYVKNWRNIIS